MMNMIKAGIKGFKKGIEDERVKKALKELEQERLTREVIELEKLYWEAREQISRLQHENSELKRKIDKETSKNVRVEIVKEELK